MLTTTAVTLALAAGVATTDGDLGRDAERMESLEREVQVLRDQVALLTGSGSRSTLLDEETERVRDLIHEAVADATERGSWQDGATAGWDKKFFLESPDGDFKLTIGGQLQFRFAHSFRDDASVDGSRGGFESRRTKLKFKGHAIDPSINFSISASFDRGSGESKLENAKITKEYDGGWAISVGQFKGPFMREELVSSSKQLTVERSLVNAEFGQDRSQGIQVEFEGDQFAFKGMFGDGFDTVNTAALEEDTEIALTGRVEYLAAGKWKQFSDFTSFQDEEFGLLFGGAAHYERDEYGTVTAEEETMTWTFDASVEWGGANLFAAVVGRHRDMADTDQFGFVVQGGYFFTEDLEGFARYEFGDFDTMGVDDLSIFTIGVNKYWEEHDLKWTTDIGFALDPVHDEWDSSGAAWLDDPDGEDGQVVFRSQIQLLF